jgi:hypothetical protein
MTCSQTVIRKASPLPAPDGRGRLSSVVNVPCVEYTTVSPAEYVPTRIPKGSQVEEGRIRGKVRAVLKEHCARVAKSDHQLRAEGLQWNSAWQFSAQHFSHSLPRSLKTRPSEWTSDDVMFVGKLVEDISWTFYKMSQATTVQHFKFAIIDYLKLRSHEKALMVTVMDMMADILDFGETFVNILTDTQVYDDEPMEFGRYRAEAFPKFENFLKFLRSIEGNFDAALKSPLYVKLHELMSYLLAVSLFDKVPGFDRPLFKKLQKRAQKEGKHLGPSFIHCCFDTLLFICERGYQAIILGSVEPLFHAGGTYEDWFTEAAWLKNNHEFISCSVALGFSRPEYMQRLLDAIEKGTSIVKVMSKTKAPEHRFAVQVLGQLEIIQSREFSRRLAMKSRKPPFATLVYGQSSIGKSMFMQGLYEGFCMAFNLPNGDEYKFVVAPDAKHWDNFQSSQHTIVLDDVGCFNPKIMSGGGDKTIIQILQLQNTIAHCPPQADLKDKGKTPLICELLLATTNTEDLNLGAYFSCPYAVARRFPVVIDLEVRPEFVTPDGVLDPLKCPEPIPGTIPDVWRIVIKRAVPIKTTQPDTRRNMGFKYQVVRRFESTRDFLPWWLAFAHQYRENQDKAARTEDAMKGIELCRIVKTPGCDHVSCTCKLTACWRPLTHCRCSELPAETGLVADLQPEQVFSGHCEVVSDKPRGKPNAFSSALASMTSSESFTCACCDGLAGDCICRDGECPKCNVKDILTDVIDSSFKKGQLRKLDAWWDDLCSEEEEKIPAQGHKRDFRGAPKFNVDFMDATAGSAFEDVQLCPFCEQPLGWCRCDFEQYFRGECPGCMRPTTDCLCHDSFCPMCSERSSLCLCIPCYRCARQPTDCTCAVCPRCDGNCGYGVCSVMCYVCGAGFEACTCGYNNLRHEADPIGEASASNVINVQERLDFEQMRRDVDSIMRNQAPQPSLWRRFVDSISARFKVFCLYLYVWRFSWVVSFATFGVMTGIVSRLVFDPAVGMDYMPAQWRHIFRRSGLRVSMMLQQHKNLVRIAKFTAALVTGYLVASTAAHCLEKWLKAPQKEDETCCEKCHKAKSVCFCAYSETSEDCVCCQEPFEHCNCRDGSCQNCGVDCSCVGTETCDKCYVYTHCIHCNDKDVCINCHADREKRRARLKSQMGVVLSKPLIKKFDVDRPSGTDAVNPYYQEEVAVTAGDYSLKSKSWSGMSPSEMEQRLAYNCATLIIRYPGGKCKPIKAFCVGGQLWVTTSHSLEKGTISYELFLAKREPGITENIKVKLSEECIYRLPLRDLAFFVLRDVPCRPFMTDLFSETLAGGVHDGFYLKREQLGGVSRHEFSAARFHKEHKNHDPTFGNHTITEAWKCTVRKSTQVGDCGAIMVLMVKKAPVLAGIHFLGDAKTHAVATVIRPSDIRNAAKVLGGMEARPGKVNLSSESAERNEVPIASKSEVRFVAQGSAVILCGVDVPRPKPKSQVFKTKMFQALRSRGWEDEHGAPMLRGWVPARNVLLDVVEPVSQFDPAIIDAAAEGFANDLKAGLVEIENWNEHLGFLSLRDAVNGIPGIKYIDGMKRSTSAGYPWCRSKKSLWEPKPSEEHPNDIEFNEEILLRVEKCLQCWARGERYNPIFNVNLKDEVRSKKKCETGQTRGFTGAPVEHVIAMRMVFLSLIKLAMDNQLLFECAAGIVATSIEWTKLYKHLTKFGKDRVFDGDYGKYDKKFSAKLMITIFLKILIKVAELSGKYDEEQITIMTTAAFDVAFPWVHFFGVIMMLYGTNPSGQSLTTLVNCLGNSVYMRCAFLEMSPQFDRDKPSMWQSILGTFKKLVALITYGDDNAMGVHSSCDWFNHTTVSKYLGARGIEYTAADKESESKPFKNIEDCTFLKRGFKFIPGTEWCMAQLEMKSIRKMLMYGLQSAAISEDQQCIEKVDSAMREFFFYGEEVYNEHSALLQSVLSESRLDHLVRLDTFRPWTRRLAEFVEDTNKFHGGCPEEGPPTEEYLVAQ